MSKIDSQKIIKFIEGTKNKKPTMIAIDNEEWANALDAYHEIMYECVTDETTTEELWNWIYFSAMAFCRGIEYSEVKQGIRKESLYPRY